MDAGRCGLEGRDRGIVCLRRRHATALDGSVRRGDCSSESCSSNQIDLVHIHHLMHVPLSQPLIARACGVPTDLPPARSFPDLRALAASRSCCRFCDVVNRVRGSVRRRLVGGKTTTPPGSKARRGRHDDLGDRGNRCFVTSTPETARYLQAVFPGLPAERLCEIAMVAPSASPQAWVRSEAKARHRSADRSDPGQFRGHQRRPAGDQPDPECEVLSDPLQGDRQDRGPGTARFDRDLPAGSVSVTGSTSSMPSEV